MKISVLLITIALMVTVPLSAQISVGETAEVEEPLIISEFVPFTVGDRFKYDFNIDNQLSVLVEDDADYVSYQILSADNTVTVTGTETILIKGESLKCWILRQQEYLRYNMIGDGSYIKEIKFEISKTWNSWMGQKNNLILREDTFFTKSYEIHFAEGQSYTYYQEEEEVAGTKAFSEIGTDIPFPLKVGKIWTNKISYSYNATIKNRDRYDAGDFSDWITTSEKEDVAVSFIYEILSENDIVVPAGTYQTLKIKKQDLGSQDYKLIFKDKCGLTIQYQTYEDSELNEIHKLSDSKFNMTADSDRDGVMDIWDAFPDDAEEQKDSDGDGRGDNSDDYPDDPSRMTKKVDDESIFETYSNYFFMLMGIVFGLVIAGIFIVMSPRRYGAQKSEGRPRDNSIKVKLRDYEDEEEESGRIPPPPPPPRKSRRKSRDDDDVSWED